MADSKFYLDTVLGLGLVYAGRKLLDLPVRLPQWDRWLKWLWLPGGVLVAAGFLGAGAIGNWFDDLFIALVLVLSGVIGWQLRAYRPALWVGVGLAPYGAYLLLDTVLRLNSSYTAHSLDSSGNVDGLSILWAGGWLLIARSQGKTLAAAQQRRLEAEQEKQVIETQNQFLAREVHLRTAALAQQTDELRTTLSELQTTQDQLIQREKMASLGELTAGIAHEIQNPLNFVNNFADVSAELIMELEEERARPARDLALEAELLHDLKQNLQRITQHGGRAAGIVKGMLAHSRASTGERQPTDVNALCDEYLRLAYHGLRAKDKSFNATLQQELAASLPLVEAVPGDLGRVLLNLFTNAFYAVQKRQQASETSYVPTVRVASQCLANRVIITVADNGTGIPEAVKARIFQPFFTTKPTGEGTGLGLSLAHDIIVQGHGGTLTVESQEGAGTTFIIQLPL